MIARLDRAATWHIDKFWASPASAGFIPGTSFFECAEMALAYDDWRRTK